MGLGPSSRLTEYPQADAAFRLIQLVRPTTTVPRPSVSQQVEHELMTYRSSWTERVKHSELLVANPGFQGPNPSANVRLTEGFRVLARGAHWRASRKRGVAR